MTHAHADLDSWSVDWRTSALCATHPDPTLWDADVSGETRIGKGRRHAAAVALCGHCPVRGACSEAVQPGDEGVRGGRLLPPTTGTEASDFRRPCGTEAAYRRHRRRGETPCQSCVTAARIAQADRRLTPSSNRSNAVPCGTAGGWARHKRHGEPPCQPCLEANRTYHREYSRKVRSAKRAHA